MYARARARAHTHTHTLQRRAPGSPRATETERANELFLCRDAVRMEEERRRRRRGRKRGSEGGRDRRRRELGRYGAGGERERGRGGDRLYQSSIFTYCSAKCCRVSRDFCGSSSPFVVFIVVMPPHVYCLDKCDCHHHHCPAFVQAGSRWMMRGQKR